MATLFGSPPFLSLPTTRTHHFSSSKAPPPPPPQPLSPPPWQPLSTTEPPSAVSAKEQPQTLGSTLSRRFGLTWAAFLGIGVLSEQIKTRLEVFQLEAANARDLEKQEEEVVLPNGIRYYDLRVGGGPSLRPGGDLVVIDLKGNIEGSEEAFVNTFGGEKRPLAVVMGSRPYTKGMCEGIECVLRSMKAGGRRKVMVPPSMGFGENGADFGSGFRIPPNAALEYVVEVDKVFAMQRTQTSFWL